MSVRRSMKQAVVEHVTSQGWPDFQAAIVAAPGKPNPDCGVLFLGVWGASRQWASKTSAEVQMAVNLTLTMRIDTPSDRWSVSLDELEDGFDEVMDTLASILYQGQNEIRARADELMPAGLTGFVEAPRPLSDGEPVRCTADWWDARPGRGEGDGLIYGFRSTLQFGGWTFIHPWNSANL